MRHFSASIPITTAFLAASFCNVEGFSPSYGRSLNALKTSKTSLSAGGFGGGGGMSKKADKKKKSAKEAKLKPKQQWDRYSEFKREPKIQVAVRIKEDEADEWLEVGRVKSKDSEYTAAAVFRQRAIIAEHAKRLYPLQMSTKKTLEWGYNSSDDEENIIWTTVDKSSMDAVVGIDGLEKLIGFEGRPDPASGFYCVYDGGRLKLGEETSFL